MFFFFDLRVLGGNLRVRLATQRKSIGKFNLRQLATTCRFVWAGLNTLSVFEHNPIDPRYSTIALIGQAAKVKTN